MYYTDASGKQIYYRYWLNENWTSDGDSACLKGDYFSKKPTDFRKPIYGAEEYIRTKDNPKGILDFAEIDAITRKEITNSYEIFKTKVKEYNRDELATLSRNQLEEICINLNIDTINMRTEFLINKILDKQIVIKAMEVVEDLAVEDDIIVTPDESTNIFLGEEKNIEEV